MTDIPKPTAEDMTVDLVDEYSRMGNDTEWNLEAIGVRRAYHAERERDDLKEQNELLAKAFHLERDARATLERKIAESPKVWGFIDEDGVHLRRLVVGGQEPPTDIAAIRRGRWTPYRLVPVEEGE